MITRDTDIQVGGRYYHIHHSWKDSAWYKKSNDIYVCVGYDYWWFEHGREATQKPSPIMIREDDGSPAECSYFCSVEVADAFEVEAANG